MKKARVLWNGRITGFPPVAPARWDRRPREFSKHAVSTDAMDGRISGRALLGHLPHRRWIVLLAAAVAFVLLLAAGRASAQSTGGMVCPDGTIIYGSVDVSLCPSPSTSTSTLKGAFPATLTTKTSCPIGSVVVGIYRFADPVNTYTAAILPLCQALANTDARTPSGDTTLAPLIGRFGAVWGLAQCPAGQFVVGLYGRAGDVNDGVGVRCSAGFASPVTNGNYIGGPGGVAQSFYCGDNYYLTSLTGTTASYAGGYNVVSLTGGCSSPYTVFRRYCPGYPYGLAPAAPCYGLDRKTAPLATTFPGVPSTNRQTVSCTDGGYVSWLYVYHDPGNRKVRGVKMICRRPADEARYGRAADLGLTDASNYASSFCPDPTAGAGIYGYTYDGVYDVLLRCSGPWPPGYVQSCPFGTSSLMSCPRPTPDAGYGGNLRGPFDCPAGMRFVGLTGESVINFGAPNFIRLWANCHDAVDTSPPFDIPPTQFGAAPPRKPGVRPLRGKTYRTSSAKGPVKLRLGASRAAGGLWYYAIDRLVLATGCSQSTRVPGGIVISNRSKRSQHSRFSARRSGFRITGHVFGALARPSVRATVKITKRGCRGDVIKFTARPRK